jgi:hypothetical protein
MGWCNNPRRKIASDIKLYVRAHELPCRDSWDHDLWEDKANFAPPADIVLNNGVGPVAPASIDDLVFLASSERPSEPSIDASIAPESSVDRVIREESAGAAIADVRRDPIRGSVRRAHQQVLADKRVERFADGGAVALDGGFSAPLASAGFNGPTRSADRFYEADKPVVDYAATRPAFHAVPPIQPNEMDRSNPKIAIYPDDDDRFSSVPRPVEGVALPKLSPRERLPVIRATVYEDEIESARLPGSDADDGAAARDRIAPASVPNRPRPADAVVISDPAHDVQALAAEANPTPDDGEFLSEQDFAPVSRPRLRAGGFFRPRRRHSAEAPEPELLAESWEEPEHMAEASPAAAAIFDAPAPVRPESTLSLQALVKEMDDDPDSATDVFELGLVQMPDLWADVPCVCRTCRDFRPAESGDRGWCNNKWAFNHRRMVDADERPCDSSVGCWWLPHDDVWLASSDISAHGQPTPLLDLWLGQRRGRDADAESASIGRRRRG